MVMQFSKKQAPVLADEPAGPLMLALREKTVRNLVWRFYMDASHRWKWQHLSVQGETILESAKSYKKYEECLADAKDNGHVFQPSQPKKPSAAMHPFYDK
jgi:hypothetical protein